MVSSRLHHAGLKEYSMTQRAGLCQDDSIVEVYLVDCAMLLVRVLCHVAFLFEEPTTPALTSGMMQRRLAHGSDHR